jgi:phage tail protein X
MTDEQSSTVHILEALPQVYYNQALELARAGSLPEARDKLLAVLTLDPGMLTAHIVLGKVYAQIREYRQAIACWETALELDPGNAAAGAGMAKARELQTRLDRRRTYRLAVGLVVALFVLGLVSLLTYREVSPRLASPPPLPVTSVRTALENTPALHEAALEVLAGGDGIQIVGSVDFDEQRELVKAVAESQAGGTPVDISAVTVRYAAPMAESFTRLLELEKDDNLRSISVTQEGDILRLRGTVPSDSDVARAEALARALVGVRAVDASALSSLGMPDYVIQDGDTLWGLAVRFYGDGTEWFRIAEANPHLPSDHRQLESGIHVRIPPPRGGTAPR